MQYMHALQTTVPDVFLQRDHKERQMNLPCQINDGHLLSITVRGDCI